MNVPAQLTAAARGDANAWNALVERYTPLVWAVVRGHRLGDADAADVVQTTWLRLVEHLDRIEDADRVGAWLATTARRESLRIIASRRRVTETDEMDDVVDHHDGPADTVLRGDRDALLRRALNALGDRCRTLLRVLAAEPAPSYEEVSAALDMPVGSIGPTRGRCLERLRDELAALGITGVA